MEYSVTYVNNLLSVNGIEIVSTSNPFYSVIDRRRNKVSISTLCANPFKVMESAKRRYVVPSNKFSTFYSMNTYYSPTVGKSQILFKTLKRVGSDRFFKHKSITHIVNNLSEYQSFAGDLLYYINLIYNSYKFNLIITDLEGLELPGVRVISPKWRLTNLEGIESLRYNPLKAVLNTYGLIPLNIIPFRHVKNLSITNTNINLSEVTGFTPLIIISLNKGYSYFLYKLLRDLSIESLPVTLFD